MLLNEDPRESSPPPQWHIDTVELKGGTRLTPDAAATALDEAMQIIEAVGTTGIYSRYEKAHAWMKRYYPNWA